MIVLYVLGIVFLFYAGIFLFPLRQFRWYRKYNGLIWYKVRWNFDNGYIVDWTTKYPTLENQNLIRVETYETD